MEVYLIMDNNNKVVVCFKIHNKVQIICLEIIIIMVGMVELCLDKIIMLEICLEIIIILLVIITIIINKLEVCLVIIIMHNKLDLEHLDNNKVNSIKD